MEWHFFGKLNNIALLYSPIPTRKLKNISFIISFHAPFHFILLLLHRECKDWDFTSKKFLQEITHDRYYVNSRDRHQFIELIIILYRWN